MTATNRPFILPTCFARVSAAPLAVFRMLFGGVMLVAVTRFWSNGWIASQYLDPSFFFSYWGMEWIRPWSPAFMYACFGILALSCLGILLGLWYRASAAVFFLMFTYTELIDKTNYLNHYYFISLVGFLLFCLPAHHRFSLDARRAANKGKPLPGMVPRWTVWSLQLQLGLVYFFAGLAKVNPDWLLEALPLRIWLPANSHLPLIGPWLDYVSTAYAFSWAGMLYDLTIPFWLMWKRTRPVAFGAVVIFHLMTAWLFPIGMFPYIMIGASLIFFPAPFHEKLLHKLSGMAGRIREAPHKLVRVTGTFGEFFNIGEGISRQRSGAWFSHRTAARSGEQIPMLAAPFIQPAALRPQRWVPAALALYFAFQLLLPLRHLAIPGNDFWYEDGFRFSWKVMLMEKAGYAEFTVRDGEGRSTLVENGDFLTPNQEKMMSTQPDMILQFAQHLKDHYESKGWKNPEVYVNSLVTLNGRGSRPFVREEVNLARLDPSVERTRWIHPLEAQP